MSRAGVEVIVSARSEDRLKEVVAELPGRASYVTVDISDSESVAAAVEEVGEIDGLVFLAGLAHASEGGRTGTPTAWSRCSM